MRIPALLALGLLAVAPAVAAGPDPVLGTWRTQPSDTGDFGLVRVEPRGAKIRGVLVRAFDAAGARG